MRAADRLARLNVPETNTSWRHANATKVEKYVFELDALRSWPEIDCDMLLLNEDDGVEVVADDGKSPAVWPLSDAFAINSSGELFLSYTRTAPAKEVRSIARILAPHLVKVQHINLNEFDVVTETSANYFARVNRRWLNVLAPTKSIGNAVHGSAGVRDATEGVHVAVYRALRRRYEWSAIFNFPSGISLRFGCDPKGALRLFNDRDRDRTNLDAEIRRKALLHWVRRHWRKSNTEQETVDVRKHLRGVTDISWQGMDVQLVPAQYDLETLR